MYRVPGKRKSKEKHNRKNRKAIQKGYLKTLKKFFFKM